jgi:hypothetical protein
MTRTANRCWILILLLFLLLVGLAAAPAAAARDEEDEFQSRLGLADLAAYRAALEGRATADDPSASQQARSVSFRQIWDHPERWSGHLVRVQGRVARVFRQEAVGSFPPLVEAWLSTPAGDLFCTVSPARAEPDRTAGGLLIGQEVAFTGTFLRSIRYTAGDQPRLAPLIVGHQPPAPAPLAAGSSGPTPAVATQTAGSIAASAPGSAARMSWRSAAWWTLGLLVALTAAGLLARHHLRQPRSAITQNHRNAIDRSATSMIDPPLEFCEMDHGNG